MSRREKLLHPATLISLIALFVAMGGVGYAATQIGTNQIKNRAVTNPKLATNSVSTSKIRRGAVRNGDLANNSVSSAKIQPGSIVTGDLGNGAVTGSNIANGTIGTTKLQNGSVVGEKIGTGAVTATKLGANSVTSAAIAPGAVGAAQIAPGQVVRGNGQLTSVAGQVANGTTDGVLLSFAGLGVLQVDCSGDIPSFDFLNTSGTSIASIYYWGITNGEGPITPLPGEVPLAPDTALTTPNSAPGHMGVTWLVTLGTGAGMRQASIQSSGVPVAGVGCDVSAQATYRSP